MSITHLARLKEMAGTEIMLFGLLSAWESDHHVLATSRIPEFLNENLAAAASVSRHKSVLGVGIPKRIQPIRDHYVAKKSECLVSWSQYRAIGLGKAFSRQRKRVVHYDHGASWNIESEAAKKWMSFVDEVVCVSHANKRVMELRFGLEGLPVKVCFNPSRRYITDPECAQEEPVPSSSENLIIGMAGRLTPLKGLLVGIHAFRHLCDLGLDVELVIAGTGEQRDELQKTIHELGLIGKVRLCGHVEDMSVFYRSLSLFWSPTLRDPCPLVTLEALSYGIPVIASRVDGLPEQISEGVTGFTIPCVHELASRPWLKNTRGLTGYDVYDPDLDDLRPPMAIDPETLALKSAELLGDRSRVAMFGAQAMAVSRERFHIERYRREISAAILGSGR